MRCETLKLVKLGDTRTADLVEELDCKDKVHVTFYHNLEFGLCVVYEDAGYVVAELVELGEDDYPAEYTKHVLDNLADSCTRVRPNIINTRPYETLPSKLFSIFTIVTLSLVCYLIVMGV